MNVWMDGFVLLATLTVGICQVVTSVNWTLPACQSFQGFTLTYESIMLLFSLRQFATPLANESSDFTLACSCSGMVLLFGLYTAAVVSMSMSPTSASMEAINRCAPSPVVTAVFVFCIVATLYIFLLMAIALAIRHRNQFPTRPETDAAANESGPLTDDEIKLATRRFFHKTQSQIITIDIHPQSNGSNRSDFSTDIHPLPADPIDIRPQSNGPTGAVLGPPSVSNSSQELCSICISPCEGWMRQLQCGHEFHAVCIEQWLKRRNSCALCRRPALTQHLPP